MKNVKLIGFLMLLSSSLMFIQCTSDAEIIGPQGVAGINGTNGIDGTNGTNGADGVDGTATCVSCHSENHRTPIENSYLLSSHNNQTIMYDGSTLTDYTNKSYFYGSCARCHSNEGYIDYINGEEAATINNPTVITCTTCHEKHSTFDFENDGYDYALRNFEPVTLIVDETKTIDFGDTSNTCAQCHQPRTATPTSIDGKFTISSSHWGPHHGPQATLIEGIQGANIVGNTAYPTPGSATHRTGSSCVKCHMGETTDGSDGAHSWVQTLNACTTCHTSGAPSEVGGLTEDMETLAILLEAVTGEDAETGDPIVGIIHDGHPQEGIFTITEAEAAWNYLFILEDKSGGIHNPAYAKALIKNSIEALQP